MAYKQYKIKNIEGISESFNLINKMSNGGHHMIEPLIGNNKFLIYNINNIALLFHLQEKNSIHLTGEVTAIGKLSNIVKESKNISYLAGLELI